MPRFIFTNQQNASWENSSWPFIVLNVISHLEFISFTDINSHRSLPKLTVSDMMLERKRHRQRFFFSSINPFPPSSSGLLTNGSTHVLFSMKLSFILHDNGSWDQCLLRRKYTVEWLRKLMWRYLICFYRWLMFFDALMNRFLLKECLLCIDIMVSSQLHYVSIRLKTVSGGFPSICLWMCHLH